MAVVAGVKNANAILKKTIAIGWLLKLSRQIAYQLVKNTDVLIDARYSPMYWFITL